MKKIGKSILEVFQKIRGVFRTQSDIHDGALLQKEQLKVLQELALTWEIILYVKYIGNGKFIYWQVPEFLTHLDWNVWFAYSNFSAKNDVILLASFNSKNEVILLKLSAFRKLQVFMKLIFGSFFNSLYLC